jgi:hypothetical protein
MSTTAPSKKDAAIGAVLDAAAIRYAAAKAELDAASDQLTAGIRKAFNAQWEVGPITDRINENTEISRPRVYQRRDGRR